MSESVGVNENACAQTIYLFSYYARGDLETLCLSHDLILSFYDVMIGEARGSEAAGLL